MRIIFAEGAVSNFDTAPCRYKLEVLPVLELMLTIIF